MRNRCSNLQIVDAFTCPFGADDAVAEGAAQPQWVANHIDLITDAKIAIIGNGQTRRVAGGYLQDDQVAFVINREYVDIIKDLTVGQLDPKRIRSNDNMQVGDQGAVIADKEPRPGTDGLVVRVRVNSDHRGFHRTGNLSG